MNVRLIKANQATAARRRVYFHVTQIDGVTSATGEAGGQPQISTNGGAWTNTGIGTLTAIGNGRYYADATQSAVATAGDVIETRYKGTNTAECPGDTFQVVAFDPDDAVRLGLTAMPNANAGASGGLPTGDGSGRVGVQAGTGTGQLDLTSGRIKADVSHWNASAVATPDTAGHPKVTLKAGTGAGEVSLSSGTVTTGAISNNAITASAIAADAITAAKIADGAIDRATFAADTGLQSIRSSTAQAGAAGSITLDASASATTDFYVGAWVLITGGTGAGQARVITAYNGSTKVATIAPNWATNPNNTSTFAILAAAQVTGVQGNVTGSVGSVSGAVGSVTGNVGGNVAGSVGSVSGNVGGNVTGSVGSLAAQAQTDVRTAMTNQGYTTTRAGYLDTLNGLVAAIWDAAASGLSTAGSIGKLLVDNINATIGSRLADASYTAPDNAGIAAIQAKTDQLDFTGGDVKATLDGETVTLDTAEHINIADALLKRDWTAVTGAAARSVLNAMRSLRNKIAVSGGVLTVYQEDDTTAAYTAAVTTNLSAHPIVAVDPES